jgi:hypothetical protein
MARRLAQTQIPFTEVKRVWALLRASVAASLGRQRRSQKLLMFAAKWRATAQSLWDDLYAP